jgi:hypothetical protein
MINKKESAWTIIGILAVAIILVVCVTIASHL